MRNYTSIVSKMIYILFDNLVHRNTKVDFSSIKSSTSTIMSTFHSMMSREISVA